MSKYPDLTLREFSGKNASWSDAVEIASIALYAFREAPPSKMLRSPMYRFDGDILRPVYAVSSPMQRLDALVARTCAFRDCAKMQAVYWYNLITKPTARCWIAYDPKDNAPVGLSLWFVPEQTVESLPWTTKVKVWLEKFRTATLAFYLWLTRPRNSVYVPAQMSIFAKMHESFELETSDAREDALVSSDSPGEYPYPAKFVYELSLFCVTRQGLGAGRQLFGKTLDMIESSMKPVVVKGKTVPPQAMIIATPEGRRLYSKFGFKDVGEYGYSTYIDEKEDRSSFTLMRKNYNE